MGTLPGAVVIPAKYGESMVLYSTQRVEAVVDGAPVGPRGRLFVVEPFKTTKVPYEAGRFILAHYAYTGVVRVEEIQSDEGIRYDVAKAKQEAESALAVADETEWRRYIVDCVEDYVKRNKPVPEPPERILEIIKRRGYDLKKFGIVPIGWENPEKDARITELEAQLKGVQAMIAAQSGESEKDRRIAELEKLLEQQTAPAEE